MDDPDPGMRGRGDFALAQALVEAIEAGQAVPADVGRWFSDGYGSWLYARDLRELSSTLGLNRTARYAFLKRQRDEHLRRAWTLGGAENMTSHARTLALIAEIQRFSRLWARHRHDPPRTFAAAGLQDHLYRAFLAGAAMQPLRACPVPRSRRALADIIGRNTPLPSAEKLPDDESDDNDSRTSAHGDSASRLSHDASGHSGAAARCSTGHG